MLDTKAPYMCSAEMNAILNKNAASVKGCSIYVALFPDNEAAKLIIQAGTVFSFWGHDFATPRGIGIHDVAGGSNLAMRAIP
jgi:hypothetical protein